MRSKTVTLFSLLLFLLPLSLYAQFDEPAGEPEQDEIILVPEPMPQDEPCFVKQENAFDYCIAHTEPRTRERAECFAQSEEYQYIHCPCEPLIESELVESEILEIEPLCVFGSCRNVFEHCQINALKDFRYCKWQPNSNYRECRDARDRNIVRCKQRDYECRNPKQQVFPLPFPFPMV